jgi:tRNA threonylcarbamoyladenosine biosynthesis protein TsaB
MRLLAVETSTPSASVALIGDEGVIRCDQLAPGRLQTELLMVAIDRLLKACGLSVRALDGFAVTIGPGAFIGVRVGIATVKGLALATGRPVVPVSTLEALAARALEWKSATSVQPMGVVRGSKGHAPPDFNDALICPMLDARRREVYAAHYRFGPDGALARDGEESLVRPEVWLSGIVGPTLFLGDGAELHRALIVERLGDAALFPPSDRPELMMPSAAAVARLAARRFREGGAVDPADVTAVYLRPAADPPAPAITRAAAHS